jgi:bifunctional non-homologous end joining protein LigD
MLPIRRPVPLTGDEWLYEPAYGGARVVVDVTPGTGPGRVSIRSIDGHDVTAAHPAVVAAFATLTRRLKAPVRLDGELVGDAFVAFDVLADGPLDVRPLPLVARRARLERILANVVSPALRLGETSPGDGRALYRRAAEQGAAAIVAKRAEAPYHAGPSADWRVIAVTPAVAPRARRRPGAVGARAGRRPAVAASRGRRRPSGSRARALHDGALPQDPARRRIVEALAEIEARGGHGTLDLGEGRVLDVTHLARVFWPAAGITKGELMRYAARVAPWLLPAVDDRPLVMQRFPQGVGRPAFFQQHAPPAAPPWVRVETLPSDRVVPSRLVGGSLATLLYMTQIGVIAQDPWFSRVASLDTPDHAVLDLDPMPGVRFARVVDVARWIGEALDRLGAPSVIKTSGATGLHVYVPLTPGTSYTSARLFCQLVATLIADRHPDVATIERAVDRRGRSVYVDFLQNSRGKTLATAYSARASAWAGVSTPLAWDEVTPALDPRDFTLRTIEARLARVGDLWARLRAARPLDLETVAPGLLASRPLKSSA